MRFQRTLEFIILMVVLTMVGAVHAQGIKYEGEIFDTAPLNGDVFRCYVSNVSSVSNAIVVNVRIYDDTGHIINKGATQLKNCKRDGGVTLLPHETCSVEGWKGPTSSLIPERTAAHCQFTALGNIRGSLESHLEIGVKDSSARLRADAKRTTTDQAHDLEGLTRPAPTTDVLQPPPCAMLGGAFLWKLAHGVGYF